MIDVALPARRSYVTVDALCMGCTETDSGPVATTCRNCVMCISVCMAGDQRQRCAILACTVNTRGDRWQDCWYDRRFDGRVDDHLVYSPITL